MKKGDISEGTVRTVLFPNKGIVLTEDGEVLVKNVLPGQRVRFVISKKRRGRAEGRLLEVLSSAPQEKAADCPLFPDCGGCSYRTLPYDTQLQLKENQIRTLLEPVLSQSCVQTADDCSRGSGNIPAADAAIPTWDRVCTGIRPSPLENAYRNKMEYSFGDAEKDGPLTLGLHRRGGMYDILSVTNCRIVHNDFNRITACVQEWARKTGLPYYHRRTHTGLFRHLLVRRGAATGEILIDLVTTSQYDTSFVRELVPLLLDLGLEGTITGILHTTNDSVADTIIDEHTELLYGRDHFFEEILGLRFKITPFSFFQTNSKGAEVLYDTARQMLGDVKDLTVYDLYSGTGTIAQLLAPVAREAVGVEIVEEAVAAARENAACNGLTNCRFLAGDVLTVLDELTERPDVIVLDPPRDGVHPKALPRILAYKADRILYISCKPTSLARDLPFILSHGYTIEGICCVDMFPGTVHCEVICSLRYTGM